MANENVTTTASVDDGAQDPDPRANLNTVVSAPLIPAPAADAKKAEPAAADDPAKQETQEATAETPEQQDVKRQSKFQRRLERQKTARIVAETEARLLREENAKLRAEKAPQQQDTGEPKREQFEDYESYLRALARFDAAQEARKVSTADREERQRSEQQQRSNAGNEKVAQAWTEREKAFSAEAKDYIEVVTPFVEEDLGQFSDAARRAIVESEKGPHLLYHLAQNPDVAEAIAELSPIRQIAELTKLELKLAIPAKRQSNAPAPIKPIGSGRSAAAGYSDNMTDAEYRDWRKSQGARWARR